MAAYTTVVTCISDFNHEETEDSDGDRKEEGGARLHSCSKTCTMRFSFGELNVRNTPKSFATFLLIYFYLIN